MADDDVQRLDARVGSRRRSRFIAEAVRRALDDEERWDAIESAIGGLADGGHAWDREPGAWVRTQRQTDTRRVG